MSPGGRFRFSLETVLKVRRLREEQAILLLAQALRQLERSRRSLQDTQGRWQRLVAELKDAGAREWSSLDFKLLRDYLDHLKLAITGWQERIRQEEAIVEQRQGILQTLYQERRLLERLREKKFLAYKREVAKVWEKETEAIALTRWAK